MPYAPKHPCSQPGCPALVERGKARCPTHTQQQRKAQDASRPHSAGRGYGHNWRKLRRMVLARSPLCADCGDAATEVHHLVSFADGGMNTDENLQALCKGCHSKRTAREGGGVGR